ncbi:hypothetical protein TWF718_001560 [Orbilia javanica]|uniref:Uncharacterized protein n=1 Tax=Orbilia javanica TaxID=47235 RepID=A0AAN8RN64_9PEZI
MEVAGLVIAVVTVAVQTSNEFAELRGIWKQLPGRLDSLGNEVSDIETVLNDVSELIKERDAFLPLKEEAAFLKHLNSANNILVDVKKLVGQFMVQLKGPQRHLLVAYRWRKEQGRLEELQTKLLGVKSDLMILLGASHSRDMMNLRLEVQSLSLITATSTQEHFDFQSQLFDNVMNHSSKNYEQIEKRITEVADLLKAQSQSVETRHIHQFGPLYRPPLGRRRISQQRTELNDGQPMEQICVRTREYASNCRPGCPCSCHVQTKSGTPALISQIFGRLMVSHAGIPLVSRKCDNQACENSQAPRANFEYWFPMNIFWSQIIRLQLGYSSTTGPQLQLSTLRRVSDSAQSINFALNGNIDGLKDLFKRGLASPKDVSDTRGYTLLRWAMYGKQYETCKFLLYMGADPDYRPVATSDNSPKNKASDLILQGGLSDQTTEILRTIAAGSDFVEEQNFTRIHRVVIELLGANLEEELELRPEDIDATDALGRTPLLWAAARGHERYVATLLSYGADPNIMDSYLSTAVAYAADRGHAICVRLLLEAGADPDPPSPNGYKVGSALNCAARNTTEPVILKTLLDFGADVESCGVDGKTSLIHAVRNNNVGFVILLLEYSANINAKAKSGETVLSTAVIYNSHEVLRVLLERWSEYSRCPRLQAPHLLEIAALYADIKTLNILAESDHLRQQYDQGYVRSDFINRLMERIDVSDELILSFKNLASIISHDPKASKKLLNQLDSGLHSHRNSGIEDNHQDCEKYKEYDDSDDDDVRFEDTVEFADPK